jgi:hypothetical protein
MKKKTYGGKKARRVIRIKMKSYTDEERQSLEGKIVPLAISGKLRAASHQARRRHRKLGIPMTHKEGSKILKVYPDGRREVLANVDSPRYVLPDGVIVVGES